MPTCQARTQITLLGDYELHLKADSRMPNLNTVRQLDSIKERVIENLRYLKGAPCVQMTEVPPDHILYDEALKRERGYLRKKIPKNYFSATNGVEKLPKSIETIWTYVTAPQENGQYHRPTASTPIVQSYTSIQTKNRCSKKSYLSRTWNVFVS